MLYEEETPKSHEMEEESKESSSSSSEEEGEDEASESETEKEAGNSDVPARPCVSQCEACTVRRSRSPQGGEGPSCPFARENAAVEAVS